MNKGKEKSWGNPSVDLVMSDMNLARAFASVARSAYGQGRASEGDSARTKTIRFYCEALREVLQMGEQERKSFSSDLESLRTHIEWLSVQSGESERPLSDPQETASMENLLRLLEEKG